MFEVSPSADASPSASASPITADGDVSLYLLDKGNERNYKNTFNIKECTLCMIKNGQ